MLMFPLFYRRYGVRLSSHLMAPLLPDLKLLELPRFSIYHYPGSSKVDPGPARDEFLFRNIKRPIMMMHVTKLGDSKGNPRVLPIPVLPAIRKYHQINRRYRQVRDIEQGLRDSMVPFVFNYSYLLRMYRYNKTIFSE